MRKDFIHEMVKWRQGVIYGQWRIHETDFLRLNIAVPSVNEQRLIGKLLDNLDSLITLHQREPPHTMKEGKNANRYQWRIAFLRLLLAMD